ncbi:hypothetical protein F2Q69_00014886 [Brassica cretica]|uniref:Uncharacterized protein n=1 Tax=Brassica cretica TaxID=69181 RepID=A0A8S9R8Y0_BRACR|nr:hypothetical protein F2Q69_00014886 [Brassica cretica]
MEEVKEEKPIGNQQVQGEDRHGDTACKIRSLPSRHRHGSVICSFCFIQLFSSLSHAPPLPLQRPDALATGIWLLFFIQSYPGN